MMAESESDRGTAVPTPSTPQTVRGDSDLRLRLRGLCSACRQVLGIPDYERYLAHAALRHPDAPVLTRGDFCAQEIDRKYGGSRARCC